MYICTLAFLLGHQDFDAPEVNIVVVGHSTMMLEYCLEGVYPKPNNNAVFEKLFVLEASTERAENGMITRSALCPGSERINSCPPPPMDQIPFR